MRLGLLSAFGYAFAGILHALKTQRNARIHVVVGTLAILLAVWLGLSPVEWAVLALTIGLVISAELANSAVETLVDLVSPEYHPRAKIVKDVAAGAVMITAMTSVAVGLFLFGCKLAQRIWR